jgi:hypothetical protein
MSLQFFVMTIVVSCCFVYATWTLMPQSGKVWLAQSLLRLPLPVSLPVSLLASLQKVAQQSSACNCSGCDRAPGSKKGIFQKPDLPLPQTAQPIVFHPRKP